MGSSKVEAGFGLITGFPAAGRVNGAITQGVELCADNPAEPANAASTAIHFRSLFTEFVSGIRPSSYAPRQPAKSGKAPRHPIRERYATSAALRTALVKAQSGIALAEQTALHERPIGFPGRILPAMLRNHHGVFGQQAVGRPA